MKNLSIFKSTPAQVLDLKKHIEEGLVRANKHPSADLYIYNYSPLVQYGRIWNDITLQCRGLILDGNYNVIARPFPKFFNLGEMESQVLPDEPFEVMDKMDGSLGIVYHFDGKFQVATRGSFQSDQSVKAMELLNEKYPEAIAKMKPEITYLVEIIYPDNRIVVDYGEDEKLTLLGMTETATGVELPLEDIGLPLVKSYPDFKNIHELKAKAWDNHEGFIVRYESGFRVKLKFEEYVRLHRIITQVSSISIWDVLRNNEPMDEFLDRVPDEFYQWVKKTKLDFENQYAAIEATAKSEFKILEDRKTTAMYFQNCTYPGILFSMLDGKDYSGKIWQMLRPEFEKPFVQIDRS